MSAEPVDAQLVALLDTLIPPSASMPGAGGHGLAAAVRSDAIGTPLASGLDEILAALPARFESLGPADREAVLQSLQEREPAAVAAVVNLVYTAYYTDPQVLEEIGRSTGYRAGAPQPRGYDLPAFDIDVLTRARQAGSTWREA